MHTPRPISLPMRISFNGTNFSSCLTWSMLTTRTALCEFRNLEGSKNGSARTGESGGVSGFFFFVGGVGIALVAAAMTASASLIVMSETLDDVTCDCGDAGSGAGFELVRLACCDGVLTGGSGVGSVGCIPQVRMHCVINVPIVLELDSVQL
jgi:hypothetical protein